MSIIIKGMKMPESCYECVLTHAFFRNLNCAELSGMRGFQNLPHMNDRHPDCPLGDLHQHGDLIDRDQMLAAAREDGIYDLSDLPEFVAYLPVVIPKEEEAE